MPLPPPGSPAQPDSLAQQVGSGVVVAGPDNLPFAQVLTCAHTLLDKKPHLSDKTTPNPNFMKVRCALRDARRATLHFCPVRLCDPQLYSAADDVIIIVAEYVSDEACEWRYLAKVVTPEPLLSETGA